MLRIGVAAHRLHVAADALCGRVAAGLRLARCAVNLVEHREVDVHSKGALDGLQIGLVAVRRELDATPNAASATPP